VLDVLPSQGQGERYFVVCLIAARRHSGYLYEVSLSLQALEAYCAILYFVAIDLKMIRKSTSGMVRAKIRPIMGHSWIWRG
jgi:hypothetical protein